MQCVCIYDARSLQAEEFADQLNKIYGWEVFESQKFSASENVKNSVIITLGGDGLLLRTARMMSSLCSFPKIYPINYGTLGFLTNNRTQAVNLEKKIKTAVTETLYFLDVTLMHDNGEKKQIYAINDISVLRNTGQAAHLKISVNGITRMQELVADGIVISTPAGSTAYNFSVGGPIFGTHSKLISIQPVSPFRPRHWRGALLNENSIIDVEILQAFKRPVSINVDYEHFTNIEKFTVKLCRENGIKLLFDKNHTMEDKIILEQFSYE